MVDITRYAGLQPDYYPRFIKEAADSNYDNQIKNAVYNDVIKRFNNHDIKQLAIKPSYKKVLIREFLTIKQENIVRNNFPELDLVFLKEYNNPHAIAAASRKCEFVTLLDKLGYYRNNANIIDVGGNILQHYNADNKRVHCCSPLLTAYDEHRLTTRTVAMRTNACCSMSPNQAKIYDDYSNILLQPNSYTQSICLRKAQDCPVKAELAMALHSLYDIPLTDLGDIMVNKGIQMLVGTFIWHPSILLDDEGEIEDLGVSFVKDKKKNIITFSFNDDSSFVYEHKLDTYLAYVVNNSFVHKGNRIILELQENRSGIQYIKITRSILTTGSTTPLNSNIWFSDRKMCMVKYYSYDGFETADLSISDVLNPKVKVTQFRKRHFFCDEQLVQQGIAHAMRSTDTNFKSSHIFAYLTSINRKWYIGGKEIMDRVQLSDTSKLYILANVIFVYVYDIIFRQSKAVSMSVDIVNYNRQLNEKSLWGKFWSRPSNAYKPIDQDYNQYKMFNCGNFMRKAHALMYNWKKMDIDGCTLTKPTKFIPISSITDFLQCESTIKLPDISGEIAPPLYETFKRAMFPSLDVKTNIEPAVSSISFDRMILQSNLKVPQSINYDENIYNEQKFITYPIKSNKDCIIRSYLVAFGLKYSTYHIMSVLKYMHSKGLITGDTNKINDVFNSYNFFFHIFMRVPDLYLFHILNQLFPCYTVIHSNVHRNYLTLDMEATKYAIHILYNCKHVDLLLPEDNYRDLKSSKFYEKIDYMLLEIDGLTSRVVPRNEECEELVETVVSTAKLIDTSDNIDDNNVDIKLEIEEQLDSLSTLIRSSDRYNKLSEKVVYQSEDTSDVEEEIVIGSVSEEVIQPLIVSAALPEDYLDGQILRPGTPDSHQSYNIFEPNTPTQHDTNKPIIDNIVRTELVPFVMNESTDLTQDLTDRAMAFIDANTKDLFIEAERISEPVIIEEVVSTASGIVGVKAEEIIEVPQPFLLFSSEFITETLDNNNYKIWLSQSDIANIVNLLFDFRGYYFEIIGSYDQLVKSYLDYTKSSKTKMFFVINYEQKHWVLLAIINEVNIYIDPSGVKPISYVRRFIEQFGIKCHHNEYVQQKDGYNCGILALDNIQRIIDNHRGSTVQQLLRLIASVPSDEYLIAMRIKCATILLHHVTNEQRTTTPEMPSESASTIDLNQPHLSPDTDFFSETLSGNYAIALGYSEVVEIVLTVYPSDTVYYGVVDSLQQLEESHTKFITSISSKGFFFIKLSIDYWVLLAILNNQYIYIDPSGLEPTGYIKKYLARLQIKMQTNNFNQLRQHYNSIIVSLDNVKKILTYSHDIPIEQILRLIGVVPSLEYLNYLRRKFALLVVDRRESRFDDDKLEKLVQESVSDEDTYKTAEDDYLLANREKFSKMFDYIHKNKLKLHWDITNRLNTNKQYINRCSYKLLELLSFVGTKCEFSPSTILDLGGAPGGFVDVLSSKYIFSSIDSVSIKGINYDKRVRRRGNVRIHICDHQNYEVKRKFNLILSDMGDKANYKSQDLFNQSLIYTKYLNSGGVFISKNGNYFDMNLENIILMIRSHLVNCSIFIVKPLTSRITNSECYLIAIDDGNNRFEDYAIPHHEVLESIYNQKNFKVNMLDPALFKMMYDGLVSFIDPEIYSSVEYYRDIFSKYYGAFIKSDSTNSNTNLFREKINLLNKLIQCKDSVTINASQPYDNNLPLGDLDFSKSIDYIASINASYSLSICDHCATINVNNFPSTSNLNFSPRERLSRFELLLDKYIEFIRNNKLFEDVKRYYHFQTNSYETINPNEFDSCNVSFTNSVFPTIFIKFTLGHEHDIYKMADNIYLVKLDKSQNLNSISNTIQGIKEPTAMALFNPAIIPQSTVVKISKKFCHHLYLNENFIDEQIVTNYVATDVHYKMLESIKEIRRYWDINVTHTLNNAKRSYDQYSSNDYSGIMTDKSAGIISLNSGNWFKTPYQMSSRNYSYCYDGNGLIPLEYRNGKFYANTSADKVLVNRDTSVVISPQLSICTEQFESFELVKGIGKFNVSSGAPGSGKSSEIIRRCSKETTEIGDIILTMTKESCNDLRKRLLSFGLSQKILKRKVKTIDSFLLNSKDTCNTLWIDEVYMSHPGTIFLAALKSKAATINIFGDSAQIPFLNRLDGFVMNHNDYNHFNWEIIPRHHSFRCPRDVIYVINSINVYGFPITGSNQVSKSMYKYIGTSDIDTSADVNLTFTQVLKSSLISKGLSNVYTIHEFQGKEAKVVNIIRDNSKDMEVYNSDPHLLVALSRHTQRLNYHTVVQDKLADYIDLATNCDTNVYYKPISHNAGDSKLLWDIDQIKSEYFQSIPEYQMIRTGNDTKFESSKLAMEIALTNSIPCSNYTVAIDQSIRGGEYLYRDKIPISGVIPLGIDYLQDVYDTLLPGQSRLSRENEQEIISTASDIRVDDCQFSTGSEYKVFRKRSYLTPNLRTSIQPAIESNLSQILYAYSQRNGGAPDITGTIDRDKFVDEAFTSFVNTYIDTSKEHLINSLKSEITIDAMSIDKWLNDKPQLRNILKEANKMMDDINLTKYSFILKRNPKPSLDDNSLDKLIAPQTIAFHNKLVNAIFCPIMRIIKARLLAVLKDNYLINTDMSLEEFEAKFSTRLPPNKAKRYRNTFEVDISKFDKSHNMYLFDLEERILLFLGFPKELMPYWRWAHTYTTLVNVMYKFRGNIPYQRKSGDPATYLGNTIILMACLASVYDLEGAFCLFSGDDSYIFTNNEPRHSKYMERFATSFNFESKIINKKMPYFCSKFLVPVTDNRWKIVPDLLKLLTKLGRYDLVNYEHAEMYRVSTYDILRPVFQEDVSHLVSLCLKDRYGASIEASSLISTLLYYTKEKENFAKLYRKGEDYVDRIVTILPNLDI